MEYEIGRRSPLRMPYRVGKRNPDNQDHLAYWEGRLDDRQRRLKNILNDFLRKKSTKMLSSLEGMSEDYL